MIEDEENPISKISIETTQSKFVLPGYHSNQFDVKTYCFYFPQFEEVSYKQISKKMQELFFLEEYVRKVIKQGNFSFKQKIDSDTSLNFKTFNRKEECITPTSKLSFNQCIRVKVFFEQISQINIPESKVTLQIKVTSSVRQIVLADVHKKLRIGELLILYKLDQYKFASLIVNGTIIRHYQSLQQLDLQPGYYEGYLLLTFQTFYHDMREHFNKMLEQGIDFQLLAQQFSHESQQNKALQEIYNKTPISNVVGKVVQMSLLYITSSYFQFQEHKKYLFEYFNGKIKNQSRNRQSQIMSLLINSLKQVPEQTESVPIFIYEQIQEDLAQMKIHQGQIFLIENLCPATDSIEKMKLKKQKKYIIYEIEHLSAKYIERYTCQHMEYTHIILPFTHYKIQSIKKKGQNYHVCLIEIPLPQYKNRGLILWITRKLNQAKAFFNKKISPSTGKYQLMLLRDFQTFSIWLQRYQSLIVSRKYCIIFNKDDFIQGIKTIELVKRTLKPNAKVLLYLSQDYHSFEAFIDEAKVKMTTQQRQVEKFIFELQAEDLQQIKCEACKCQIN